MDRIPCIPLDEERAGLGLFQLTEDVTCQTVIGPVTVPKGYVTDFASIPRFARWLCPQAGHSTEAALLHDYLLSTGDKRATEVFNARLKEDGAGLPIRCLMVAFVWLWTYPELHWAWMQDHSGH